MKKHSPPCTSLSALRKQAQTVAILSLMAWFAGSTNKATAQAYVVSTNTTWTSSSQVPSSATTNGIEIRPGATLTISGFTLTMATGKSIVVQSAYASFLSSYYSPWNANAAGGKLIVNNSAVLTGTDWQGIVVWGVTNASQGGSVPKHGRVEITRATVEGCRNLTTGDYRNYPFPTGGQLNPNSTGGIVIGVSATFHNSGAINLNDYKWNTGNVLHNDASRFTLCNFITDNISPTAPNGASSINVTKRRGIYVVGCTFTDNRNTTPSPTQNAVNGRDANVYVLPFCTGVNPQTCNLQYTTTNKVGRPVEVTSFPFNTDRTVVSEARLNDVTTGILLGGAHSAEVTRNEISVVPSIGTNRRIGIYVTHSNTPKIWDNTLTVTSPGSQNYTFGIVTTESGAGSAYTDVYGNKMTDFHYQTQAVGVNRGSGFAVDAFGLRYLCNTFTNDF